MVRFRYFKVVVARGATCLIMSTIVGACGEELPGALEEAVAPSLAGEADLSQDVFGTSASGVVSGWQGSTKDFYRDRPVQIMNGYSWMCLRRTSESSGAAITQTPCQYTSGSGDTVWMFRWKQTWETWLPSWYPIAPFFSLQSTGSGSRCADIPSASLTAGVDAQLFTCSGSANQTAEWIESVWNTPRWYNRIRWRHPEVLPPSGDHLCWDTEANDLTSDRFQQWNPCHSGLSQMYSFDYYACLYNGTSCSSSQDCCSYKCSSGVCAY